VSTLRENQTSFASSRFDSFRFVSVLRFGLFQFSWVLFRFSFSFVCVVFVPLRVCTFQFFVFSFASFFARVAWARSDRQCSFRTKRITLVNLKRAFGNIIALNHPKRGGGDDPQRRQQPL
jgi:hypothetical protein